MAIKKLFLIQLLIEADVSEWPDFDEAAVVEHVRSALNLSAEDKLHRVQAYLLARMPDDPGDLTLEKYEDRGFGVEICQDAATVGTDVPTYFAVVTNLQSKTQWGSFVGNGSNTVDEAKEAARLNIDKRIERQKRRDEKK